MSEIDYDALVGERVALTRMEDQRRTVKKAVVGQLERHDALRLWLVGGDYGFSKADWGIEPLPSKPTPAPVRSITEKCSLSWGADADGRYRICIKHKDQDVGYVDARGVHLNNLCRDFDIEVSKSTFGFRVMPVEDD